MDEKNLKDILSAEVCGVTVSLFYFYFYLFFFFLGGGGKGVPDLRRGGEWGLEDGIAMIFVSPSHLLCTIKSQIGGAYGDPIVTPLAEVRGISPTRRLTGSVGLWSRGRRV